ncbi:hypothetical protein [Streptomyces zagrosensis]|uniref:PE-PGRS family protein n=1 Tax=Streptomyces zagrosensis TaxID=1042984 RepID=A0A7W9UX45_9ACTN|nr:hypothetical protein [Streptomyces zagrosensis]MBB5933901.1 hypothetical protein [Streptomyces zagrosensis]
MDRDEGVAVNEGTVGSGAPAGPYLGDYTPTGPFRLTSARTASVLFYRNGGYSVATVSGTQHFDKPMLGRPYTVCEIALGTFETTLHMELPAAGGTTFFKAEVDIHWNVTNPHLVATEVVTDIAGRLTAPTLERLREVSAEFRVNEAEQADRAITRQCASGRWDDLGADLGLRVRLYVRLRVDDRTIQHMDGIRDARASAEVTQVHQGMFRTMLQGNELDRLSYMLAADPEAAKDFLEKVRQEGRQDEKERIDRLFAMVASGQIQSNDVEAQALSLLNQGRQHVRGPIGPLPAHRERPQLEPSADEPFTPDWVEDEPPPPARRRPYPPPGKDDTPQPPRRRSRRPDDGWAWAEGD